MQPEERSLPNASKENNTLDLLPSLMFSLDAEEESVLNRFSPFVYFAEIKRRNLESVGVSWLPDWSTLTNSWSWASSAVAQQVAGDTSQYIDVTRSIGNKQSLVTKGFAFLVTVITDVFLPDFLLVVITFFDSLINYAHRPVILNGRPGISSAFRLKCPACFWKGRLKCKPNKTDFILDQWDFWE